MVLVGMIVTWASELILHQAVGYLPWNGFNVIAPMIIALLANTTQRQGLKRTVAGAGLATMVVFLTLHWV